ncbi:MAG: O-antigen ligase family protein [Verrucomicrobiota bacterium]
MWEEEYPLPGYQSNTERYATLQFITLGIGSTWFVGGDFAGGYAICASIAALSLFFYFFLGQEVVISTSQDQKRFRRWLLVPLLFMILWPVSQLSPTITEYAIGDRNYLTFIEPDGVGPVTSILGHHWQPSLYLSMMLIAAIGYTAFTVSHYAITRTLWVLLINATVLGAVGLLTSIMHWEKILSFITPAQANFFSTFPSAHQWSAFALFWTVVGFGLFFHLKRRQTWTSLLEKNGAWLIAGWLILAYSAYETGTPFHRFLLGISVGLILLRIGTALVRYMRTGFVAGLMGILLLLAGISAIGYNLFNFANEFSLAQSDPSRAPFGIPWGTQLALWRDTWQLFLERPFFGWGAGSFQDIFPFHQQVDLGNFEYTSPHSDILHVLFEYGIVGLCLLLTFPIVIAFKFAFLKQRRMVSHYLWGAVTLLVLLSLFCQPLSTPANLACLWFGIAAAYKWSEIEPVTPKSFSAKNNGATSETEKDKRKSRPRRSSQKSKRSVN